MEDKEIRKQLIKEHKGYYVFGSPEKHGDWYYYWLLCGNNKKIVRWNAKTGEHDLIVSE